MVEGEANACGVGYDVDGTTKQFFHGGVKAGEERAGGPGARRNGMRSKIVSVAFVGGTVF